MFAWLRKRLLYPCPKITNVTNVKLCLLTSQDLVPRGIYKESKRASQTREQNDKIEDTTGNLENYRNK